MTQEKAKVTPEIMAAITAAIAVMLDKPASAFKVKNVAATGQGFSWAKAGILELMASRQRFWK